MKRTRQLRSLRGNVEMGGLENGHTLEGNFLHCETLEAEARLCDLNRPHPQHLF